MTAEFQLGQPLFLLLAIFLPLLWLRRRRVSIAAILLRSAVLLLVILALADPLEITAGAPRRAEERVFAFDLSRSVPEETRLWMARQNILPRADDRVFVFGGAPEETNDWKRRLEEQAAAAGIKPERTNLEALFAKLLETGRSGQRVYLFTDGWENDGSAERLLPALAQAGIKVFPVLPPERPRVANIAVKKVLAPQSGAKGETVTLKVMMENSGAEAADGALILKHNGRPFKNEAVRIEPGGRMLAYQSTVGDGPLESFQAQFVPRSSAADRISEDNQATGWVGVQAKEKVLVLNGRSGEGKYLEDLARRRGFEVTSVTADTAPPPPSDFGIVVLNNAPKEKFSPQYLGAIERHAAAGNGLLIVGDESSLAPPGYRQTAIAAALPIEPVEPKQKEPEKTRAVVVLIDKSSSMNPTINKLNENRLLYAKQIARRILTQLADTDFVAAIGFDTASFSIVPLDQVKNVRSTFDARIELLIAKGNTEIVPPLEEAMRLLRNQAADVKHVVLLTDADRVGGRTQVVEVVTRMRNEKIQVSAVGVGHGVDEALIKRIAAYGGGVSYIAEDLSRLPEIVFQHIGQKRPETAPAPKNLNPVAARDSEILAAFQERLPPVSGYVESELKKGARRDALVPDGKNSPLLASWRYGKGKVAALTIDQAGRWSRDWIPWPGMESFWGKIFEWLKPAREILPPHEVRVNRAGERTVLDLYLYGAEADGRPFRYSFSGPRDRKGDGALQRIAAGHYRAELPLTAAGDYRIDLKEERSGRTVAYPPVGYTLEPAPQGEIPRSDFNLPLLERIADATGGAVNPTGEEKVEAPQSAPKIAALRLYFIFAAAFFFLIEILIRRLLLVEA